MQTAQQKLLSSIPKVDVVCAAPCFEGLACSALADAVREVLDELRSGILSGAVTEAWPLDKVCQAVQLRYEQNARMNLRPVINGTGVVLHTNLGRACLSARAVEAVCSVAASYSTLEYDPTAGRRGSRHDHVEGLLRRLCGTEAAMVVNNNAAAVLLMLTALAHGREVVISRGELVEIGGSFRVPDVMHQSGAVLREVGTTNKTHPSDYEQAIGPETAALLKVHTSNYRIVGFVQEVELPQLVEVGRKHGLPVFHDLGSGLLYPPLQLGVNGEPPVADSVKAGADLITFSGDKLLGGPQAGIIVGRAEWIEKLKKHPLARALRIDKLTLAALEATLRAYLDPEAARVEIPVLAMINASEQALQEKAQRLLAAVGSLEGCAVEVVPTCGQVGGGSVPTVELPSYALAFMPQSMSVDELDRQMYQGDISIVGRIYRDRYLLDVRTIFEAEFEMVAGALRCLFA
ncbi:MAG: L-seryl-tRNA(Sec) selenium transferase [Oscillospiraceae bacterium]